jgi:hypothetical protein
MKNIKFALLFITTLLLMKCEFVETDFGYNGALKGTVKDNSGTPIYADINSNTLVVKLLGENDKQAIEIRVNGDGNYQNLKLFPKKHEVWLEGPIMSIEKVIVDFTSNPDQILDFKVTPLISPKLNSATGSGTSINIDYALTSNSGNTIKKKEVYCSTVKFPTAATGSRTNVYFTKTVTLPSNSGTLKIDGLTAGVKYYIRIGAQDNNAAVMNYSNQIEVSL